MSMANVAIGHTGPGEHWEPALTLREAAKMGISKNDYESAALYARTVVEENKRLGTPRDRWEPTASLNYMLAAPYIGDGEQGLVSRLQSEADPQLDKSQDLVGNVKANLDEVAEDTRPIAAPEAGTSYSVAEAVNCVERHDATIESDEAAGKRHHRRTSRWLQFLAKAAPWVESIGFLTFITYYLNVPLLQPWLDWLGWSFGLTVVLVIIVGQTWLVGHAASSHNHALDAHANGRRHQAEAAYALRNRYLALTAVTAVAITSGMIWRGVAALGSASFGTTAVMILVAAIAGLLLPALTYLGVAFNGSKISRERDSFVADLNDDLERYLETISDSRRDLADAAAIGDTLRDKTFPDICNAIQQAVDEVYEFYGTVRLLIGGLSADPPTKTTKTIHQGAANSVSGYIGTSILGTRNVNLDRLFDRERRLSELERQGAGLLARIGALPPHPWGKPRTADRAAARNASRPGPVRAAWSGLHAQRAQSRGRVRSGASLPPLNQIGPPSSPVVSDRSPAA
jgi:hypothetical protein